MLRHGHPGAGWSPPTSILDLPAPSGLPFEGVLRGIAGPLLHGLRPRHCEVQPHASWSATATSAG